jgi:hypothetical protein
VNQVEKTVDIQVGKKYKIFESAASCTARSFVDTRAIEIFKTILHKNHGINT